MFTRAARVQTAPIETRLGPAFGRLRNVSATGALIRTDMPLEEGRHCSMFMNLPETSISLSVRVVRTEAVPTRPASSTPEYLVAVRFEEISAPARKAIGTLCRPGRVERA